MNPQQEERLVLAFSNEIKEAFFRRIPSTDWRMEQVSEQIEVHPYLYSLHFDWKNYLLTIRLEQAVVKSAQLFPHVYYRLLHFLEVNGIDLLVRNDNHSLKQHLYKKRRLPIDASGEGSREIVKLLEVMGHSLQDGVFFFWKDQKAITFSTPLVPNLSYKLHIYPNAEIPAASKVEIDGAMLADETAIRQYFRDVQAELVQLQEKEREIMDYAAQLHAASYYDPLTESLTIFQKNVRFSLKLLYPEKNQTGFCYAFRFGTKNMQADAWDDLMDELKKELLLHVKKDRLRAITEGRI